MLGPGIRQWIIYNAVQVDLPRPFGGAQRRYLLHKRARLLRLC